MLRQAVGKFAGLEIPWDGCFVIQPFDRGKFDKRFEDVFAPALRDAGLEPYRVDRDPRVTIPIEEIATQIAGADACLCDITTDNPNVWFELGFAISSQREVVLICADERKTSFPFDVQHRAIIQYSTDSSSDFQQLRTAIASRLQATLEKRSSLEQVNTMTPVAQLEGLEQFEVAALVAVAQQLNDPADGVSAYLVRQDMENAGFTKLAANLGLRSLVEKNILSTMETDDNNGSTYTAYQPTRDGIRCLFDNKSNLALKVSPPRKRGWGNDDPPF